MPSTRDGRIFNKTVAEQFRAESHKRTEWGTRQRRLLNRIADILDGQDKTRSGITVQDVGILLEANLERFWPIVREVCDAVPGIRWASVEFGIYLGIRPSAPRE
jgi:hypothetical protein